MLVVTDSGKMYGERKVLCDLTTARRRYSPLLFGGVQILHGENLMVGLGVQKDRVAGGSRAGNLYGIRVILGREQVRNWLQGKDCGLDRIHPR